MESLNEAAVIAVTVQMAVAPIFLLVAIGSILSVMTQRLGRVVDRARDLEHGIEQGETGDERRRHVDELAILDRRMVMANRAIAFCSAAAVLVCVMVALLFVGELFGFPVLVTIAVLFVITMASLITGLTHFFVEISIATRSLRVRGELLADNARTNAD